MACVAVSSASIAVASSAAGRVTPCHRSAGLFRELQVGEAARVPNTESLCCKLLTPWARGQGHSIVVGVLTWRVNSRLLKAKPTFVGCGLTRNWGVYPVLPARIELPCPGGPLDPSEQRASRRIIAKLESRAS